MYWDYDLVNWTLFHYNELRSGIWPDKRTDDIEVHNRVMSSHAPFENPCLLAAEVAIRVKWCGVDGYMVEERFGMGARGTTTPEDGIAFNRRLPADEVHRRINRVKQFVADRPAAAYDDWKRDTKYERRMRDFHSSIMATATSGRMLVS